MNQFKNRNGEAPAYYMHIQYYGHSNPITRYSREGKRVNDAGAIQEMEKKLLDHTVEWCVLYDSNTRSPIHYYHHRAGINKRLSKEQYKMCLTPSKEYNLWIIPTIEARNRGIEAKAESGVIREDIPLYYDKDVLRIDIYFNNKKVGSYQKGVFV